MHVPLVRPGSIRRMLDTVVNKGSFTRRGNGAGAVDGIFAVKKMGTRPNGHGTPSTALAH